MSRDDYFQKIQEVLDDALGVDEDEVTPDASLTADLGAESIDFLDIVFRLEKTFDFKIWLVQTRWIRDLCGEYRIRTRAI